uniref:Thioredoxin domain-containing protein n=1 Tax=Eptatretus burgeri TaxID=7764 RepID=A0A8C4R3Q0_EPTBU
MRNHLRIQVPEGIIIVGGYEGVFTFTGEYESVMYILMPGSMFQHHSRGCFVFFAGPAVTSPWTMATVKIETKAEFEDALAAAGGKLVVIKFSATWCGPCRNIHAFFETLVKKYHDVIFGAVDVDDLPEVAEECGVQCMPTFLFYKNKEKVHTFSGANENSLEKFVKELK